MADAWIGAASVSGVCLGDEAWLEIEQLAVACRVEPAYIERLIDEGLMQPQRSEAGGWRFGGDELARVRRIRRLQRDFEANLQSVAVMLDLMDEIERLHGVLHRVGLRP